MAPRQESALRCQRPKLRGARALSAATVPMCPRAFLGGRSLPEAALLAPGALGAGSQTARRRGQRTPLCSGHVLPAARSVSPPRGPGSRLYCRPRPPRNHRVDGHGLSRAHWSLSQPRPRISHCQLSWALHLHVRSGPSGAAGSGQRVAKRQPLVGVGLPCCFSPPTPPGT